MSPSRQQMLETHARQLRYTTEQTDRRRTRPIQDGQKIFQTSFLQAVIGIFACLLSHHPKRQCNYGSGDSKHKLSPGSTYCTLRA